MSLIKKKIMESAIYLFSVKGYKATSIQDIADDCSIAKGSIYKHFSSKEDLYIKILGDRHLKMMEDIDGIKQTLGSSARDIFMQEIAYQISFFLEHGCIVFNDRNEGPSIEDDKIVRYINKLRINLLNYYRDILLRHYGTAIESFSWDAAVLFNGIVKEYILLMMIGSKPLPIHELSSFIGERMDDLVQGLHKSASGTILSDTLMRECILSEVVEPTKSIPQLKAMLYEVLLSTIQELGVPNSRKQQLMEAILFVQEELKREDTRGFLLHALLQDLATESELRHYVHQLSSLIYRS